VQGDLFGTNQSGFDQLKFASWTNLTLITEARKIHQLITEKTQLAASFYPPVKSWPGQPKLAIINLLVFLMQLPWVQHLLYDEFMTRKTLIS
jgi:hypothetical protein